MPFTAHSQFSPTRAENGVPHKERLQVGKNNTPEGSELPCWVLKALGQFTLEASAVLTSVCSVALCLVLAPARAPVCRLLLGLGPLHLHSPCWPGLPGLTLPEQGWNPMWGEEPGRSTSKCCQGAALPPAFLKTSGDQPYHCPGTADI